MSDDKMRKCEIGGIINNRIGIGSKGYGFKLSFHTVKEAQHYKEMIQYILLNDNYKINSRKGYNGK